MAIINSLTKAYAQAIYLDGTRTFEEIKADYVEPVKQHAAATFSDTQIETAFANGWITQTEYDETMALKTPA